MKLELFQNPELDTENNLRRATLGDPAAFAQGGSTSKEPTQLLGRTAADIPVQGRSKTFK